MIRTEKSDFYECNFPVEIAFKVVLYYAECRVECHLHRGNP